MFAKFIAKIKTIFRDPLEDVIEWEEVENGKFRLTQETYRRAGELGYSNDQIEVEAMERTGSIW